MLEFPRTIRGSGVILDCECAISNGEIKYSKMKRKDLVVIAASCTVPGMDQAKLGSKAPSATDDRAFYHLPPTTMKQHEAKLFIEYPRTLYRQEYYLLRLRFFT